MRRLQARPADQGSMAWVVILSFVVIVGGMAIMDMSLSHHQTSRAEQETNLINQAQKSVRATVMDALASGDPLPASAAAATVTCETVAKRALCSRWWAEPQPASAAEPIRYSVRVDVWIDRDRDRQVPATGVRSVRFDADAITYRDDGLTVGPRAREGWVEYHATPRTLWEHGIYAHDRAVLSGPGFEVSSYNSSEGLEPTGEGVVGTSGRVLYGPDTAVDGTVLWGGVSDAGADLTRCTGEACGESPVTVVADALAAPTADSEAWISGLACAPGDWVSSEHNGQLAPGETCVLGDVVIDAPVGFRTVPATLVAHGNVYVHDDLAASPHAVQDPAMLRILSLGSRVVVEPPARANALRISALIYAPFATCGNQAALGLAPVEYHGSLVCDAVHITGQWTHLWDADVARTLTDPAPDSHKVWRLSPPELVMPTGGTQ